MKKIFSNIQNKLQVLFPHFSIFLGFLKNASKLVQQMESFFGLQQTQTIRSQNSREKGTEKYNDNEENITTRIHLKSCQVLVAFESCIMKIK